MKKLITLLSIISFLIFFGCKKENIFTPQIQVEIATSDQYIITLNKKYKNPSIIPVLVKDIIKSNKIDDSSLVYVYDYVLKGFCSKLTTEQLNSLKKDTRIGNIEVDQFIDIGDQPLGIYYFKNDNIQAQTVGWGVNAVGGFVDCTGYSNVVWIVDSGINFTHPDLNVDTVRSKTFIKTGMDALSANDLNGHGTHVAGIVAAKNNGFGSVGVASGATLIAIKVLNLYNCGFNSDIISGLNYVAANGAQGDIVNCSFGGLSSIALDNAVLGVANAGMIVVIAAGNNSRLASYYSPGRLNAPNVYTISAYGTNYVFASWSNYGNPSVDYSAPGVSIYSTYKNGGYATMSGTSMSAPFVSGILLANGGMIYSNKFVTGDKDSIPDPVASRIP